MRDSVSSSRYSSFCNVLHQWRIWLIPTYRVYPPHHLCSCPPPVSSLLDVADEVEDMRSASPPKRLLDVVDEVADVGSASPPKRLLDVVDEVDDMTTASPPKRLAAEGYPEM